MEFEIAAASRSTVGKDLEERSTMMEVSERQLYIKHGTRRSFDVNEVHYLKSSGEFF